MEQLPHRLIHPIESLLPATVLGLSGCYDSCVNKDWARTRLESYLEAVRTYQHPIQTGGGFDQDAYEVAMKREPAAKAIMRRINPDFQDYDLVQSAHTKAFTLAVQSLALLDDAEEIEINLGTPGPRLEASEFHPWVWQAARSLWETGHYREAVQTAATSVNAHIQDRVGRRDVSDYKLTTELFSDRDPEPKKPRLRWPASPDEDEFKSMQAGIRSFGSGIFQCIRNRATHDLTELSEQAALERLAAMSLFCHWVETCSIEEAAG